ncbi:MAG: hypothetical protein R6W79_00295, partial [Acidimicrobiia bacterium]
MFGMRNTASDPVLVDPVLVDRYEVPFEPGQADVAWVDPFPDGVMGQIPGRVTESVPPRLDGMAPGPV